MNTTMKYTYYYATHRRSCGTKDFEDLFDAIHYMNKHISETFGIVKAVITDTETGKTVCSARTFQ